MPRMRREGVGDGVKTLTMILLLVFMTSCTFSISWKIDVPSEKISEEEEMTLNKELELGVAE